MRIGRILIFAAGVLSTPIALNEERGLFELLEGDANGAAPAVEQVPSTDGIVEAVSTTRVQQQMTMKSLAGAGVLATLLGTSTSSVSSTHHSDSGAAKAAKATTSGGGGTANSTPQQTAAATGAISKNEQVSVTPPGELAQWKVIGISIICVTFVAIVIVAITFFDTWTAFLGDLVGCGGCRKGQDTGMFNGREVMDLAPDWDRRTWEFKLSNEDGHRYPTMESLDSIGKI